MEIKWLQTNPSIDMVNDFFPPSIKIVLLLIKRIKMGPFKTIQMGPSFKLITTTSSSTLVQTTVITRQLLVCRAAHGILKSLDF